MRLPSYLTGGINNKTSQTIPHFPNFGQIPFQESIDKFWLPAPIAILRRPSPTLSKASPIYNVKIVV